MRVSTIVLIGGTLAKTSAASFRSEVDDPVGALHDVEVVLDDDDGVSRIDEPLQNGEQALDVFEVKACRGLVEDVQRAARLRLAELA